MKKHFSLFLAFTLLLALSLPAFAEEQSVNRDEEYCGIRYTVPASWEPVDDEMSGAYYTEITCEGRTEPAWCWIQFYYISGLDSGDNEVLKENFVWMMQDEFGPDYMEMGMEDITFAGRPGFMYSLVCDYADGENLFAAHCIAVGDVLVCVWATLDYHAGPLINTQMYEEVQILLESMDISGFDRDAVFSLGQPQPENKVKSI